MRSAVLAASVLLTPTTTAMCGGGGSGEVSSASTSSAAEVDTDPDPGVEPDPACVVFDSQETESAPLQRAAAGAPSGASGTSWSAPAAWTSWVAFSGSAGQLAHHEGIDWIHGDPSVPEVDVATAAAGEVVYVRTGCPESDLFARNTDIRECGSGWGNHVVVHHGGEVYTRYAHLRDGEVFVEVGDELEAGDVLGVMGNSGRSEVRHLHFELGTRADAIDPCAPTESFDAVYDPATVGL